MGIQRIVGELNGLGLNLNSTLGELELNSAFLWSAERTMGILLIEDEPRIRAFITRGLGAEGFTVDERDDGRAGLSCALSERYDLVILDLALPSMDGLTVLEALSSRRPKLPVVILSASSDLRTRAAAFSRGASDYLEKPFAFDDLLARVRTHLRRGVQTAFQIGAP